MMSAGFLLKERGERVWLSAMLDTADASGMSTLPRYEDYVLGIEPSDVPTETPEEYFERLEKKLGGDTHRGALALGAEMELCQEAQRRLNELRGERRKLYVSLLRYPITPSGIIGMSMGILAVTEVVPLAVAFTGQVANAGVAGYYIYKKVHATQKEVGLYQRVVDGYREKYGDTATDILLADVERDIASAS